MIAALFYLQYHSARNRLVTRIKRLQQPKYLIGAIAGGLYFYFYFFRYLFGGNGGGRGSALNVSVSPEHLLAIESLAALALFIAVLLAWLIPHERASLTFTEAEVAFLFPAPVSRRTLVHFKLMKSQLRIFFSAFIFSLFFHRFGGNVWIHSAGWWLVLSILNLHFLGASFARTLLLERGISNWLRRLLVFLLASLLVAGVVIWARNTLAWPENGNPLDLDTILSYSQSILTAGPAAYVLYPFRVVVNPFFAADAPAFFAVLAPGLLLLLLHYLWVIFSDVAFEEASLAASQKAAARVTALRTGNWAAAGRNQKVRRAWFKLAPAGPPFTALLWKNLIGAGRVFSLRFWIMITALIVTFTVVFSSTSGGQGLAVVAGMLVAMALGYSLLLGPQMLRLDFRQDLPMADILKTYPVAGWQLALGEILAPALLLAGFQWLLLVPGSALIFFLPGNHQSLLLAIALGAAIFLPVLDFILLLIPNAAVLLFPSWLPTGKDSPRGIEATGQRLIFAIGQLLVLSLTLLPASLAFLVVYFPLKILAGPVIPVFLAAPASAIILAGEAAAGVYLLGKLFERFDVTEEKTA
jgi:ABC-2 type transport system permease protein